MGSRVVSVGQGQQLVKSAGALWSRWSKTGTRLRAGCEAVGRAGGPKLRESETLAGPSRLSGSMRYTVYRCGYRGLGGGVRDRCWYMAGLNSWGVRVLLPAK